MSNFTAREQLMLELVNRARMDPQAEASRFGIGLNDNLPAGTITAAPKQVLAGNDALRLAARNHSDYMLANNEFIHEEHSFHDGFTGADPGIRMDFAGYDFVGSFSWGENISVRGGAPLDLDESIYVQHEGLFRSAGHRVNILGDDFREIGIAQQVGDFTFDQGTFESSMITQNFAKSGTAFFITGVVYNDTVVNNDFYDIGEGLSGRSATTAGASDSTGAGGGYELAVGTGARTVTVDGVAVALTVTDSNIKLDIVNGNQVWSDHSFNLLSGANDLRLLGMRAADIRGAGGSEQLVGNKAANVLDGGTGGNDTLFGEGGDDTLKAWSGNDTFVGGSGVDTLTFAGWNTAVNIRLDTSAAQAAAGGTVRVANLDIENLVGGNGNDTLRGSNTTNRIDGGGGNDTLQAWAGADLFSGGAGTDTLSFTGWGSAVNVRLDTTGTQAVAGGSVRLLALDIENVVGGSGADTLRGSSGANTINGNGGNDTLQAWAGADTFIGGAGVDTLTFTGWSTDVNIRLDTTAAQAVSGGSVRLSLLDVENVVGGSGADTLRGSSGANTINGNGGNDTLQAWAGADTFIGGAGIDTLSFTGWGTAVNVRLDTTAAQTVAGGSVRISLLDIENIVGGSGADTLRGGAGANTVNGNGGNDTLQAWAGADTFIGGAGVDTLSFAGWNAAVAVSLATTAAQAVTGGSVRISLLDIENLSGGNGNDTLLGSNGANLIDGGNGNDALRAWAGDDTFIGGAGGDTLDFTGWNSAVAINLGLTTAQAVTGGSVRLSNGDVEHVRGGNGGDTLVGSAVGNILIGGLGRDFLTGGAAADRFYFNTAAEVGLTQATGDVITDFNEGGGDVIDFSAIDAVAGGGNDAFTFLAASGAAFSGTPGEVRWYTSGGNTFVEGNTDADLTPEFTLRLDGIKALTAGDFVL